MRTKKEALFLTCTGSGYGLHRTIKGAAEALGLSGGTVRTAFSKSLLKKGDRYYEGRNGFIRELPIED